MTDWAGSRTWRWLCERPLPDRPLAWACCIKRSKRRSEQNKPPFLSFDSSWPRATFNFQVTPNSIEWFTLPTIPTMRPLQTIPIPMLQTPLALTKSSVKKENHQIVVRATYQSQSNVHLQLFPSLLQIVQPILQSLIQTNLHQSVKLVVILNLSFQAQDLPYPPSHPLCSNRIH